VGRGPPVQTARSQEESEEGGSLHVRWYGTERVVWTPIVIGNSAPSLSAHSVSVLPMTRHLDQGPPLGDTLQRAIAARAIAGLRGDPGLLQATIDAGLIDARFATADPGSSPDPVGLIREFGEALASAIEQDPATVLRLGLDPLDLLRQDSVGPSAAAVRAGRSDMTVAVTVIEGIETGDPTAGDVLAAHRGAVAAIVSDRGGRVVRHLGGAHLLSFTSSADAILALLDMLDAAEHGMSFRAGAGAGEVMVSGRDLLGSMVGTVCKVAASASAGEVLVTPEVRDPLGDITGISFGFVAPRPLTDGGDPMVLWSVHRA